MLRCDYIWGYTWHFLAKQFLADGLFAWEAATAPTLIKTPYICVLQYKLVPFVMFPSVGFLPTYTFFLFFGVLVSDQRWKLMLFFQHVRSRIRQGWQFYTFCRMVVIILLSIALRQMCKKHKLQRGSLIAQHSKRHRNYGGNKKGALSYHMHKNLLPTPGPTSGLSFYLLHSLSISRRLVFSFGKEIQSFLREHRSPGKIGAPLCIM